MHHLPTHAQGSRRVSTVFEHLSSKWIRVRSIPALANAHIQFLVSLDTGNTDTKQHKWICSDEPITVEELWTLMGQPEKQMHVKYAWVKGSSNAD